MCSAPQSAGKPVDAVEMVHYGVEIAGELDRPVLVVAQESSAQLVATARGFSTVAFLSLR
jgi:hypothetical protein